MPSSSLQSHALVGAKQGMGVLSYLKHAFRTCLAPWLQFVTMVALLLP